MPVPSRCGFRRRHMEPIGESRVTRKEPVSMGAGTRFYQIRILRSAVLGIALRPCVAFSLAGPDTLSASLRLQRWEAESNNLLLTAQTPSIATFGSLLSENAAGPARRLPAFLRGRFRPADPRTAARRNRHSIPAQNGRSADAHRLRPNA